MQVQSDVAVWSGTFKNSLVRRIHFGEGALAKITAEIDRQSAARVMLLTTNSLYRQSDFPVQVTELLGLRHAGTFHQCEQHVPRHTVLAAADMARSLDADLLISLGGGSAIDTAKAVTILLAEGVTSIGQLDRLESIISNAGAVQPAPHAFLPHITISTTLSGAEFTELVGITNEERRQKDVYRADGSAPVAVILDPEMTRDTPGWLLAGTGMRAIDHCVETLYSVGRLPMSDALCSAALGMLIGFLPHASKEEFDLQARAKCQMAMWMSIVSLPSVPQGLSHAVGHQLGGRLNVPHGICSAIVLPAAMDFNRPACADRQAAIARAMGCDVAGLSDVDAATAASDHLRQLVATLGIDARLSAWGVRRGDLPGVAEKSMSDAMMSGNPRPVRGVADVLQVLEAVL